MGRILGISASTRVWGNSEIAVRRLLLSAMEEGAVADFVRLTDLRIDPCRGCFKCVSPAGVCVIADDVAGLVDRAASADAMVLAAPVYFGLPPAILVGLLDRLLVVANRDDALDRARPAVTVTLMGNAEWGGVAEPFVNLTASLLGFEVVESVSAVAEGPGEVLGDVGVVERLRASGRALASGRVLPVAPRAEQVVRRQGHTRSEPPAARCPVCAGDFFRIEGGHVVCPVCGARGNLAAYTTEGRFVRTDSEERWGRAWLKRHVASWIRPSVERYKSRRGQALKDLRELRRLYSLKESEGSKP